jgi:hypothetical protein
MGKPTLFVQPEFRRFGTGQEKELIEALAESKAKTRVEPIHSLSLVTLDNQGFLPHGYRFSQLAFRQLCAFACRGLQNTLLDLSGVFRTPDQPISDFSYSLAIRMFNEVIGLRARNRVLNRLSAIRDVKAKVIDGILGPRTVYVENGDLFDWARSSLSTARPPVRLLEAELAGRRMALKYVADEVVGEVPAPSRIVDVFQPGFYFSNSSSAGESVRGGVMLYRLYDSSSACGALRSAGKVRHTSKDFRRNVTNMFKRAFMHYERLAKAGDWLNRLRGQNLGLSAKDDQRAERAESISRLLYKTGRITKEISDQIVATAMHFGSYNYQTRLPTYVGKGSVASRTVFDLYTAAMHVAVELPVQLREDVEQVAYRLLTGRIFVPPSLVVES